MTLSAVALCAACVAADNFRLAPIPPASPARIREIAAMLSERPGIPGDSEADLAEWKRLAALPGAADAIKKAEESLGHAIQDLPDERYLDFIRTGDRERYQKLSSSRSVDLNRLILAECLERKGRFLPKIVELIDVICTERSWTLPAHDEDLGNFNGTKLSVDLASGSKAWMLAVAICWLRDGIPSATAARARAEIRRRVFAPYLRTARGQDPEYRINPFVNNVGNWWFAFPNNWNAVCHSCVVRTALAIVGPREERAEFVEAAERTRKSYLDAFTSDGYCDEGMGYWNYGFGNELTLGLFVRRATGGKVDFFKDPKNRSIMLYPYGYYLQKGLSPHFADGGGNPSPVILALGRQVWPDIVSKSAVETELLKDSVSGSRQLVNIALRAFGGEPPPPPAARLELEELPLRTCYPQAQVYIFRTPPAARRPFAIAFKGGHNAELHNHNDVGSYTVMLDGAEIAGDPGGEKYTRRTFSPRRYESKVLSSYAHPVPFPAETLQSQGRNFAGKVLKTEFSDAADTVVMDLKGAYEVPGMEVLERTFAFDRAGMAVSVSDRVVFSAPRSFSVPIVTYCEVEKGGEKGNFVLRSKDGRRARVSIEVSGGEWKLSEEIVPNPGLRDVRRLAVEMVSPVSRAEVRVRYAALPEESS